MGPPPGKFLMVQVTKAATYSANLIVIAKTFLQYCVIITYEGEVERKSSMESNDLSIKYVVF